MTRTTAVLGLIASLSITGCGNDKDSCSLTEPSTSCDDKALSCEDVGGTPTCVKPLVVTGRVLTLEGTPIQGALVVGLDANGAPMTGTVTSAADGTYKLPVPLPRTEAETIPQAKIVLRAAAQAYEPFPTGIRRSLPIELSQATLVGDEHVVMTAQTDIILLPFANAAGTGSIAGTVKNGAGASGALVVAEGPSTVTGISDRDGAYVLFNVPAGVYTVSGYASDLALTPATGVNVAAGARTEPIDLSPGGTVARVSGSVNIVNPGAGNATSVVLVVESTFNDVLKRGEVPPGLRAPKTGAPSITGAFAITGVPPGKYVVLAAFENDFLVRDPDTQISGTQIQHITVNGADSALSASFKVTGSLDVISPGAGDLPDVVGAMPSFKWKDDSSEDYYTLEVFDTKGTMVWMNGMVPKVTGGDVTAPYGGPALTPGFYQFRATSVRAKAAGAATPISQTEDLRGVFQVK